jgi:hypothetical protein
MDRRTTGCAPRMASERDPGREIRARAWVYVFECYEKKKAGVGSTGKEAKEENDDRPADSVRARNG